MASGRSSILALAAVACLGCETAAVPARSGPPAPAAPTAVAPAPPTPAPTAPSHETAVDFMEPSPGALPPVGTVELVPFERAAYTGACPASLGTAQMATAPNDWSCLSFVDGVMHMCVGTEEAVADGGDLTTYVRTAIEGMGPAGIVMVERRDVVLAGAPAVRLVYDNPGTPGRFVSYLFARDGHGYTATCTAAPADTFDAMLPAYEAALQAIRLR